MKECALPRLLRRNSRLHFYYWLLCMFVPVPEKDQKSLCCWPLGFPEPYRSTSGWSPCPSIKHLAVLVQVRGPTAPIFPGVLFSFRLSPRECSVKCHDLKLPLLLHSAVKGWNLHSDPKGGRNLHPIKLKDVHTDRGIQQRPEKWDKPTQACAGDDLILQTTW